MRHATHLLVFLVTLLIGAAPAAQAASAPASRSGTITMQFDLSHLPPDAEVRLWLPYPVSDTYQRISDVHIDSTASEVAVYTDRQFSTPMLFTRWPATEGPRTLTFTYRVEPAERQHRELPQAEAPWDPADYALWLAPTRLAPLGGPVKAFANQITAGRNTVLAKNRAIYDWACENTYRDPETRGYGAGDVCKLLEDPGGKCGDLSSIYATLCRAAGVPARHVLGLRQGGEDITT